MQMKTFTVSVHDDGSQCEAMNRFLRGHQVLQVHREFVDGGTSSACWCFCVEFEEASARSGSPRTPRKKVDYKEVLSEETFALFARLRAARKKMAEEEDVPAYVIFTDEQLAGMAELDGLSPQTMKNVKGVGSGKIEKYAERLLAALSAEDSENP